MDNAKDPNNLSRRDLLKLAGTAAAFCASFGFLHGDVGSGQDPTQRLVKERSDADPGERWAQTRLKWYSGKRLLHTSELPPEVLKVLQTNVKGIVQVKEYQAGRFVQTLFKFNASR